MLKPRNDFKISMWGQQKGGVAGYATVEKANIQTLERIFN
jgi:hypothetical protein